MSEYYEWSSCCHAAVTFYDETLCCKKCKEECSEEDLIHEDPCPDSR